MKFLLKKVMLDRNYLPDQNFDWCLHQGEEFKQLDAADKHSSISSCELGEDEGAGIVDERVENVRSNYWKYSTNFIPGRMASRKVFFGAFPGSGSKYFKIPASHKQVGDFQFLPEEVANLQLQNKNARQNQ